MWGHKPRKVDAVGITTEIDGTVKETEIKRCCHCGSYWDKEPGSGKLRGYCFRCMDEFCGPECSACTPLEKRLEEESKQMNKWVAINNEKWLESIYRRIAAGERVDLPEPEERKSHGV